MTAEFLSYQDTAAHQSYHLATILSSHLISLSNNPGKWEQYSYQIGWWWIVAHPVHLHMRYTIIFHQVIIVIFMKSSQLIGPQEMSQKF